MRNCGESCLTVVFVRGMYGLSMSQKSNSFSVWGLSWFLAMFWPCVLLNSVIKDDHKGWEQVVLSILLNQEETGDN